MDPAGKIPKKITKTFVNKVIDKHYFHKVTSFYHLCVECFSQLSFDSEMYTKSAILYTFLNQMRVVKNIRHKDGRITSL